LAQEYRAKSKNAPVIAAVAVKCTASVIRKIRIAELADRNPKNGIAIKK
jgi:hypothetical protein